MRKIVDFYSVREAKLNTYMYKIVHIFKREIATRFGECLGLSLTTIGEDSKDAVK